MWSPARSLLYAAVGALCIGSASAEKLLKSGSLNTCQSNSGFTASLFDVVYTPSNGSASVDMVAVSSIEGNVVFDAIITAYGYQIIRKTVDPCDSGLAGLCPMTSGKLSMTFNLEIGESAASQIPGIAYSFPDLDATVKVFINMTSGDQAGESVACVEADISNGKTVDLLGVKWATAVVAGLSLASSAVVSGLGHSNAASHVAANALSLFGYFQSQAMLGMVGVHLPPAAQAWTQDFQWSMGIIRVGFMQTIFTWYQRATGGTPSDLFDSLTTVSIEVEKRSLSLADAAAQYLPNQLSYMPRHVAMAPRHIVNHAVKAAQALTKRAVETNSSGSFVVYGIQRVAYRAGIEPTNVVMTGLTFFCIFVVFVILGVAAFKGFCELAAKNKWMKSDTFLDFRNGWFTVLKGILFRVTLIGFPQMCILCLWEFTQVDSPAIVVLAVFFFFGMIITLGWAASKVIRIARRSVTMHRNPAYILFSDPQALNKWGFLYVQFRASAYYYIVPLLFYTLVKGMFVAFAQSKGTVQAIAFLLLEAGCLIAASVLRPWMDKKTNSFNIAICVINFINAIFLLIFTDVFDQPALVTGVVGVVLWILNAVFALVLLIMLIITTTLVFFRKNPDTRYQFMADDRASFMKSQTQLTTTTELDALAATARGDKSGYKSGLDLDDDNESISSESMRRRTDPTLANNSSVVNASVYRDAPRSPVDPSMPLFPADNRSHTSQGSHNSSGPGGPAPAYDNNSSYGGNTYNRVPSAARSTSPYNNSSSNLSASGYQPQTAPSPAGFRAQNNASPTGFRQQNNASPWQRGAGYDH
ncbi:calcium-related spray protein [Ophiostoma piceae UAMH 11346]|uniref:Calcium-related spray protein n=1 Tax=Ophiostoma piceae (strain UAMH 11346) TaxID=1262450 RepID=S3CB27_OPHP1|nr:calcium-related spray protein [Ophiostoma piceae UAMH 11346]